MLLVECCILFESCKCGVSTQFVYLLVSHLKLCTQKQKYFDIKWPSPADVMMGG
jgi:hypothetical protein